MEHSGEEECIADAILAWSKDIHDLKTELKQEFNSFKTEITPKLQAVTADVRC